MKACAICAKSSLNGGGYSNRVRATKFNPTGTRRRQVNLQWARRPSPVASGPGGQARILICTRCLKGGKHLSFAK